MGLISGLIVLTGVMVLFVMPSALGEHLYNTKDWGGLTSGGVGPGARFDVYIEASGPGTQCSIRSTINGDTYNLAASSTHYAMVRIDWHIFAPGTNDEGVINLIFFGGESYQVRIGDESEGYMRAERVSGSPGQSFSYTIEAIGLNFGGQSCYNAASGTFHWT